MIPKILEEHDDELIVMVDGRVMTIPNNSYTIVRKINFGGKRIQYEFAPFVSATETFNDRIFNLVYDKYLITVRQDMATKICDAILDHYKKGDYSEFKDLFLSVYSEEHQDELVEKFILELSPHVELVKSFKHLQGTITGNVYIVGEKFAIDPNGTSYYKREADNEWQFLCTVVTSQTQSYRVPMGDLGWAKLNEKVSGIIAKIVFFLNPNVKDSVFTNQISKFSPKLHESVMSGKWAELMRKV